jgi:hypothetical protein
LQRRARWWQVCGGVSAIPEHDAPILWMTSEKLHLVFEGVGHALVIVDVPLRMVRDVDEAQFEQVHMSREHVERVCASIHQVRLSCGVSLQDLGIQAEAERRGVASRHTSKMQSRRDPQASFTQRSEGWKKRTKSVGDCVPRTRTCDIQRYERATCYIRCYGGSYENISRARDSSLFKDWIGTPEIVCL